MTHRFTDFQAKLASSYRFALGQWYSRSNSQLEPVQPAGQSRDLLHWFYIFICIINILSYGFKKQLKSIFEKPNRWKCNRKNIRRRLNYLFKVFANFLPKAQVKLMGVRNYVVDKGGSRTPKSRKLLSLLNYIAPHNFSPNY